MNIIAEIDLGSLITLAIWILIAILGPIWVVRVIVQAERRATKKDINAAFENLSKQLGLPEQERGGQ